MSLFRNIFNMDTPAPQTRPSPRTLPSRWMPGPTACASWRPPVALPPARARYVAAFAYLLGRAANATGGMSDAERAAILKIAEAGGLEPATAPMVVDLAATLAGDFGATEDYLVTREFKAISTMEERQRLIRCCFLVMAADDEIDATESWLANRMAEELDVERPDLNAIRAEFHDQISGVRAAREVAQHRGRTPGLIRRRAVSPGWRSMTPSPDAAAHLGDELRVVGDAPQLHRERVAARRRDVDDDARRPRPLAEHAT